jgi:hypothetical protein
MAEDTQKQRMSEDKQRLAQEREQRAKQQQEREAKKGTPTPTQEEADLINLGHHPELADDGSGPDPHHMSPAQKEEHQKKHQEAQSSSGGYPTRQVQSHQTQRQSRASE